MLSNLAGTSIVEKQNVGSEARKPATNSHMNTPTAQPGSLTRASAFSYQCRACSRCCHGYRIRVNPFEALTLARHLDCSTTEFRERYLDADSTLKHKTEDDSCVFLGAKGCGVHPARPLACRLYPLGRSATSEGEERFFHISPHPQTEGIYGDGGTVGQYVAEQKADPFIAAADRYLELFCRCVSMLGFAPDAAAGGQGNPVDLLDADYVIANYGPGQGDGTLAPVDAMNLHIQALETLLLKPKEFS
jgi:Fe-S-cluster containining protein